MKPLYVIVDAAGDFDRTGGSSTPVRVKIYETLAKAEKQVKINNNTSPHMKERYANLFPYRVVVYRPGRVEVR
jgi:hypothetical protein